MKDIIIIGAGPAGLSAAIYAQRAGKSVLLLEGNMVGGQIVNSPEIENYPGLKSVSGYQFASNLVEQAQSFGAEIVYEKADRIEKKGQRFLVHTSSHQYECYAVILATGARNRHIGLEREEELTGRGISYCATCDGMFFKGKKTAVFGGGNTALEDAAYLSSVAAQVYVIHRRDAFRGSQETVRRLEGMSNVTFVLNHIVVGLLGTDHLEAVRLKDTKTEEEQELPVDALFIAIGQEPDNQPFASFAALDPKGYVSAGEDCRTKTEGLFAAGDCRTKTVRQLTTAAADGAVAALAASSYVDEVRDV